MVYIQAQRKGPITPIPERAFDFYLFVRPVKQKAEFDLSFGIAGRIREILKAKGLTQVVHNNKEKGSRSPCISISLFHVSSSIPQTKF